MNQTRTPHECVETLRHEYANARAKGVDHQSAINALANRHGLLPSTVGFFCPAPELRLVAA